MSDFNLRSDSVNVEQIMEQIRTRIREKRGVDYTEQQIRPHAARVEKLLELHRRQLADLLLGVVDAALLANARADLLHDLLDVHRVGAHVEISHKQLSAFSRRLSARTSSSSGASADR